MANRPKHTTQSEGWGVVPFGSVEDHVVKGDPTTALEVNRLIMEGGKLIIKFKVPESDNLN